MKIAVFGYYNALNAGDDRIQYAITRLTQGNTVVFLPHYLPPPKEYLETFDWILIGGGGLVFERVGIWVDIKRWLRCCKAKIGVLGLGINQLPNILKPELSALIEAAEFFYVRDHQSKQLLDNAPKIKVYPDLTWCFPLVLEESDHEEGIALNLLPCHWKEFDPSAWVKELENFSIRPFPFHFNQGRDSDLLKRYFGDITPAEFSLQPLVKGKMVVACRFHAIVFAMQVGKPFIAINYDDKVKRLIQESDLAECCLETTEHYKVVEKIQYVLDHEAEIRQKIAQYTISTQEHAKELESNVREHLDYKIPRSNRSLFNLKSLHKTLYKDTQN